MVNPTEWLEIELTKENNVPSLRVVVWLVERASYCGNEL